MNTTLRYWFPNDLRCRYMSFQSYQKALDCIQIFKQIDVKAEVQV